MELPENIVAVVGVDNAGNIVNIDASLFSTVTTEQIKQASSTDSPYTIAERTAPQLSPTQAAVAGFNLALTPGFFPIANDTGDNLEDSVMYQFMGKVGINTRTPFHKFEVRGGSINIDQLIKTDGYKLSGVNFGYYEKALSTIFMGNATTANMINMNALTLSGSKLVTPISKLRGIGVNDIGVVSTTMVRSDGTEFSVVNSSNSTLATLTSTAGLNLSTINHATTDTDKFLVSDSGVVKYRTGAEALLDLDAVPYTGAYKDVNLGEWGITAGNFIFDTTPTGIPTAKGSMYWDAAEETVALIMNGTTQRVGQDLFYPVKNQTGSTIPKGTGVRFAGALGASGRLLIAPFIANGTYPSKYFMGLTAEDIPNGADGQVIAFGKVRKVNTFSFTNGGILYASTTVAGGLQTTIPTAPNNIVTVAAVVYADATNGELLVRVSPGSNISEDEGIKLLSLSNKDVLQYNTSNSLWENKTLYAAGIAGLGTTTANTLAYFDTIGTLSSLSTSTYPSLTEISYVKGVTSAIQTQINGKQPQLNGLGFVKASGTTITYDNSTYLTTISGITAGGELSGTYPNPTLVNAAVTNKVLTGLNVIGGSIAATDTILEGFGKLQNQLNALSGAVIYQGVWNATTNTPTLTSSVGTKGYYYIVNVAGSTNLNGVTDWKIGDWVIFDGTTWNKVDNTDSVTSVNGYIGAVSLTTSDIPEALTPVNLYFTNARARAALSSGAGISYNSTTGEIASTITQYTNALARASLSFAAGSGAYNSTTGVITIPTNTTHLANGANFTSGTLTAGYVPYATGAQSLAGSSIFHSSGRILIGSATDDTINALQVTGSIKQTSVTSAMLSADATGKLISGGSGTVNYLPLWATANTLTNSWIYHSVYHTSVNGIGFMPSGAASEVARIESNGRVYIGATSGANASLALNVHAQGNTSVVTRFNAGNLYAMTRFMQDETGFRGVGTGYDVSEQAGFIYGTSPNSSTDSLLKFVVLDGSTGVWGITTTVKKRTLNFPNLYSSATGLATGDMYYDANGILRLAGVGSGGGAGAGVTGTLSNGYIPKATGTSTLGNSTLINDASGNLGLGVTPSAWNTTSNIKALEIGSKGNAIWGIGGSNIQVISNAYYDTSYKYADTGAASYYQQTDGNHKWFTAPSGTVGTAITFTQAATLTLAGNFLINTTTDAGFKLDVNGTFRATGLVTSNVGIRVNADQGFLIRNDANSANIGGLIRKKYYVGGTDLDPLLFAETGYGISLFVDGSVTKGLIITATGAATFSSTVTASNGTLIGGSSTSGYLGYWSGANTMAGSVNLFWNNTTKALGLGTASPLVETNRNGMVVRGGTAGAEFVLQSTSSTDGTYDGFSMAMEVNQAYLYNKRNGSIRFGANNALKAELKTNGDFDITGAYLVNGVPISTSGITGTMTSGFLPKATGTSTVGNSALYDAGSYVMGIGTTSPLLSTSRQGIVIRGGSTGAELVLQSTSSTDGTYDGLSIAMDGNTAYMFNKRNGDLQLGANNARRATLTVGGDFDITGTYKVNGVALSSGIGGSGTSGYMPKFATGTTLGNSLLYDDGSKIVFGGTTANATNTITFNKVTTAETYLNFNADAAGGSKFACIFQSAGTTVGDIRFSTTNTTYNTSSDYRLKTDYKPFSGIDLVNKINTYDFAWKINGERNFGVMAHELQEILPYAVTGIKDGKDIQSVDYSKIVPVLVQAIKDQDNKIKDQQKEIDLLKSYKNNNHGK